MPVDSLCRRQPPSISVPIPRRSPPRRCEPAYDQIARPVFPSLLTILVGTPDLCLAPLDLGAIRQHRDGRYRSACPEAMPQSCACMARQKALAITTDVTPRYCKPPIRSKAPNRPSPKHGEILRLWARTPLAVTDNLNFGNPAKARHHVAKSHGRAWMVSPKRAARSTFPVISGNCSLYNETNGEAHPAHARHRCAWA